jgi:hypothetical protein
MLARGLGESENLVGPTVKCVHGQHIALGFDGGPAHHGEADHLIELAEFVYQLVRMRLGYRDLDGPVQRFTFLSGAWQ